MLTDLLLRPQGLKLAPVEKPIKWGFKPLKVDIQAAVDPKAVAVTKQTTLATPSVTPEIDVSAFSAEAFPEGTDLAALKDAVKAEQEADKRPLAPGESHERSKK